MAGRKRHFRQFCHIPRRDNHAAGIGIRFNRVNEFSDLVNVFVCTAPIAPLNAVNWTQVAVFVCPFIPNGDTVFMQIADVAVAL